MKTQWFSALLVFKLESETDSRYKKKIESLIIYEATDFNIAFALAKEIGLNRAAHEGLLNKAGDMVLKLSFCYVDNLDLIGESIGGKEPRSRVYDDAVVLAQDINRPPTQTI